MCFFLYSSVNRIKDQYKVSVRIPPDSEKSNLIRIEGDPQGVQQAKRELLELASRMVRRVAGSCREGACVPLSVGCICGVALFSPPVLKNGSHSGASLTRWGPGAIRREGGGCSALAQPESVMPIEMPILKSTQETPMCS